jgi:hypothetical protein
MLSRRIAIYRPPGAQDRDNYKYDQFSKKAFISWLAFEAFTPDKMINFIDPEDQSKYY